MRIAPLPGPYGLYNVSAMPRFLADSARVGWQGAYFTHIDCAAAGSVDHGHERVCVQRGMHHEFRRQHGSSQWNPVAPGFAVWRAGDEQHLDWRQGGVSQFLFLETELAGRLICHAPRLAPLGQRETVHSRVLELLFDAMEADLAQGSPAGPMVGESLIAALVAQLAGMPAPVVFRPAAQACSRAIELIETRFADPLTLQDVADAAGLGVRQLCRSFHERTGDSPHQYLLKRRIDHAKRLIVRGLPLAEVAQQCGFADQSQLTRTFAKQVGTTPARYRHGRSH